MWLRYAVFLLRLQVHGLHLELESEQAAAAALQTQVSQLLASEQAAVDDAAAVRSMLQAAYASAVQQAAALDDGRQQQAPVQQQQQRPGSPAADSQQPAAGLPHASASDQGGSLGQEVGAAVGALVQRIHSLEQQLASQQQSLQEAELRQAAAPALQAAGVQCSPPDHADAAVQSAPTGDAAGSTAAAATQTDVEAAGAAAPAAEQGDDAAPSATSTSADGYGRADAQQQRVAELTTQLAEARLAEVAAKADHAASEARLQEAERKVGWLAGGKEVLRLLLNLMLMLPSPCVASYPQPLRLPTLLQLAEQQAALASADAKLAAAKHGPACSCQAAEEQRAECSRLQAEVERLSGCVAAVRRDGAAQLAEAAARAQAQQQAQLAQLAALEGGKCEMSELRSSAYAAVHRLQQALREHGATPAALPDGCEPGSVPQQLKAAVDALMAMLQVRNNAWAVAQVPCCRACDAM